LIINASFNEIKTNLTHYYSEITDSGCAFAIVSTEYDKNGNVINDFLDVIQVANEVGYDYVTTIVYPTTEIQNVAFDDNVRYVVWLAKNHLKMKFDKDAIREKHIWKDVEWGKRAKNYNPKGKDPGNVWIPTEDDGKANITAHILLSDSDVIEKLIKMTDSINDYLLICGDRKNSSIKVNNNTEIKKASTSMKISGRVIFKTSENMSEIQDNSLTVAVTSPPYWNLKDYFKDGQIGQESYEIYISRMNNVWEQCFKKLSNNGSLWININIRTQQGHVILIPKDIIQGCKRIGFYYKGIMIWHKSSGIPTGDKNIVDRHEYVLVFSKEKDFCVDKNVSTGFADYKNKKMNGYAFWNINRKAGSVGKKFIHPAIYPNGLVSRIVEMSSREGDWVLDPFLGSGTSLISSVNMKRNFVGYEYNEGFKELMISRFESELIEDAYYYFDK